MKTTYVIIAIFALAVLAAIPAMAADNNNYNTQSCPTVCNAGGDCQGGAWRTSPTPDCQCPTLETITKTPEWQQCGAFCQAGQTPPGWPYGWCDDYWLRPDSNY